MKRLTKTHIIVLSLMAALILVGFFLPLGSYTTSMGCPVEVTPTIRLHMVLGETIDTIKSNDREPAPNAGCSMNAHYVQYLL